MLSDSNKSLKHEKMNQRRTGEFGNGGQATSPRFWVGEGN